MKTIRCNIEIPAPGEAYLKNQNQSSKPHSLFLLLHHDIITSRLIKLKKICRRLESEYRSQQLRTANEAASEDQNKTAMDPTNVHATKVSGSSETTPKQQQNVSIPIITPASQSNVSQVPSFMNVDPKKAETIPSSSETALKQQHSNIPIITLVPLKNVTPVPHMMIVDPKKAETTTNVLSEIDSIVPPGFTSIITTGSVPEVPG
ncbi:hypothetical protein TanjilG_15202 [Lupinus angustifolius]|uniref:Uncharacterized protein n=1 Tax=Lupinus angustifolius TaxID=3871 RepID=A0A1J7I0G4_LUPAN|nr:hypothetical protein TanjilG_15202 [Lupinus angustifolius]